MVRPFPFTSILRRWPKMRRRVVIMRRKYDKVYWYLYEFKEEFMDEIVRAPRELKKRAGKFTDDDYPMYYKAYLWMTCIPEGFKAYLQTFKDDWNEWVKFRDSAILGYQKVTSEFKESYDESQPKYKEKMFLAIRMFRDALSSFLKGYQESMGGKPFPSDEIIREEQKQPDQSSNTGKERDNEEQK